MKQKQIVLNVYFYLSIVLAAGLALLFETNCLPTGEWSTQTTKEFLITYAMEAVAIGFTWLSLRMFKLKHVQGFLQGDVARGNRRYFALALVRLSLLCIPLLLDVVFYYLFMRVTFAGLAGIHLLSLFFVAPTRARFESESGMRSEP